MFNNLIKWSSGRTTTKVLATLLVITLTFANFALLGSIMFESIAINLTDQDSNTNSENVKFNVYLDANNTNAREVTKDINAEDLILYASISVKGGGRLEKPKIEFSNSNFELKENSNVFEKSLEAISSENELVIELPIIARKNSSYDLSLLNMSSQIKLTGEYIDDSGNITDINTTKMIKIEWQANEITEEQVELSQEVITNKIYNINGKNKKIVQILIKSNILQNMAPVKSTKIEVNEPNIGTKPEQVEVIAKNTLATNGKTNIQFANSETSKYEYNEQEGKLYIEVLNNPDENNIISWQKNVADQIIITYVYSEETNILPFTSKVKSVIELYGREAGAIQKQNEITLEEIQEMGDIASLENSITQNIYKGNMYLGEETNYETKWDTFVSYANLTNKIVVQDTGDIIDTDSLSTYYKSTKINKEQAIDILGQEGTIKIYNATDTQTPIAEIALSQETQEEYYTVNYTGEITSIIIETSKVLKAGKLEITNQKAIKVLNAEKVNEATKIDSGARLITTDEQNSVTANINKVASTSLPEPVTTISVELDKNSISNQVENTLRLTTVLEANKTSNKLFKNPTINIELPKEITEANIENASLLDDELKILDTNIVTNENGNNVIEITTEGEQTKYVGSAQGGATLVLDLKLKTEQFMADKNVEIKTTCINDGETVELAKNIEIKSKDGLVTKNTIVIGDQVIEKINNDEILASADTNAQTATITTKIINNYDESIKNLNIIGKITTNLVGPINTNLENIEIYYSTEENTEINSDKWNLEVENYANVKEFKIVLNNEISVAQEIEISYEAGLIQEFGNEELLSKIQLNYNAEEQSLSKEINYKLTKTVNYVLTTSTSEEETTQSVELSVTPKTTLKTLREGQIVTYVVSAKNTGNVNLSNLELEYKIPEGTTYTELTFAQGSEVEFTDNNELTSQKWAIDNLDVGQTVEKEVTIKINKGTTKLQNSVSIKNENQETIAEISTEPIEVKLSELEVLLSRGDNIDTAIQEGSIIEYVIIVKNVSENKMNNIIINSSIPENTQYLENSEYNQEWSYNKEENMVYYNLSELNANETIVLRFEVKVGNFSQNIKEAKIDNTVIAKTENEEEYESNVFTSKIEMVRWEIKLTSSNNKELKQGETVKYTITVKNIGLRYGQINVIDEISEQIQLRNLKVYLNDELINESHIFSNNIINIEEFLKENESLKIEIEGVTYSLDEGIEKLDITNIAKIDLGEGNYLESNEVINTLINEDWVDENPEEPVDPEDPTEPEEPIEPEDPADPEEPVDPGEPTDPEDPEETIDPEKTYSISGLAWLDENKNGIRDNNEKIITDVNVILLDEQGNIVKDEQGNNIETQTTITGTYKFNNLSKGNYTVVFVYDTQKYSIAKYQVQEATEETNSDAISKTLTIDNQEILVGITNTIKIEENDVQNIDLGLIQNAKFDLSLAKYIDKVVVTNNGGTSTYTFQEDTDFTKVEIAAKYLNSSTILIEYSLTVTNEGDVDGYVEDLMDYIPTDLKFSSDLNPDWYVDQSGNLHNATLAKQAIKSGETVKVKLILTKTISNNQTGTITNLAEIGTSSNLEGIEEFDSVAGNNKQLEDDMGKAELIISIATGSPVMYIGIVLASLIILGTGIYLINKKVLKGGEI